MMSRAHWALLVSTLFMACGCGSSEEANFGSAREAYLEAMQAAQQGDTAKAIEGLTASLAAVPAAATYMERAKLYLAEGRQDEALQDCQAALELDPENEDVKWLLGEVKKPEKERFKGDQQAPPSSGK